MIALINDESASDIRSDNALRVVGSRGARSTTLEALLDLMIRWAVEPIVPVSSFLAQKEQP